MIKHLFFTVILLAFASGCVTVKLDKGDEQVRKKAKNVTVENPGFNFKKQHSKQLDGLWVNKANGNSISYVTSCNDPIDQSMKSIRLDIIAKLDEPEVKTSKYIPFNHRKALRSEITSFVDGYETRLDIVILKKKSCVYILNYVANKNFFKSDHKVFERFLAKFRVD